MLLLGRLLRNVSIYLATCHFCSASVLAAEFERIKFENADCEVIRIDPKRTKLQLFFTDAKGKPFNRFTVLEQELNSQGLKLRWAMNAGMYHGNFAPVGLCVVDGKELAPLNLSDAEGNFFLKPNGVFAVQNGRAIVLETNRYRASQLKPELATQSGPMLVVEGKIHPKFNPKSDSKLYRNGVGIDREGNAVFAITIGQLNLYEFAKFFRDRLGCANALYFDGTVSSLYSVELKRNDFRMDLGPIIGVVE